MTPAPPPERTVLPRSRAGRRPSTNSGEARGEAARVGAKHYAYNALGALTLNAGVPLNTQRPRLDGAGLADAAVPATTPDGQPVTLNAGGFVTSLRGTTLTYNARGHYDAATPPIPGLAESYTHDAQFRTVSRTAGVGPSELYYFEGMDRVATFDAAGTVVERWLFDGIDHPLRITRGATTAYYELDLAGNVRALRASGGADLGGYRYSAFGKTLDDTATANFNQPLRWKGRWFSPMAGGIYDVRARQWAPELGVFLAVDEFEWHDRRSTLFAWPGQNTIRYADPTGRLPWGAPNPGPKVPTPPGPSGPCAQGDGGANEYEQLWCMSVGLAANLACLYVGGSTEYCYYVGQAAYGACMAGGTPPQPNAAPTCGCR